MDIAVAKEFIYKTEVAIYISSSLPLIEEVAGRERLYLAYGVVDTPSGEKLFHIDYAYSGEPILMDVFLHKDYFMKYYDHLKVIHL